MSGTPPSIGTPAAPANGAYGSYITILGANFRDAGALELASASGPFILQSSRFQADAGEVWQSDKIVFRYPFPAEGNITVKNGGGAADAGAVLPSWIAGVGLAQDQDVYTPFPSSFLGAPGTVVGTIRYPDPPLMYGGWGILVHDGVTPRLFKLIAPAGYTSVISIALVPDSGVQPDGIALVSSTAPDGGGVRTAMRLQWTAGLPDLQPTGIPARKALGAGFDPTGFFAWTAAIDGGLERIRPAATVWTVDKTLAPPAGFGSGGNTAQTFFLGSTLGLQWTEGRNSGFPLFQYFEHPELALSNAAQTAWLPNESSVREIEGEVDGVNISTTPDGKLAIVYTGGFYSTLLLRPVIPTIPEVRRPNGGFLRSPVLAGPQGTPFVLAPTPTDYAGAAWNDTGLRVVRPVPSTLDAGSVPATEGEVAVWPRPQLSWQVVVDTDGGVMVLMEHNLRLHLVKKR